MRASEGKRYLQASSGAISGLHVIGQFFKILLSQYAKSNKNQANQIQLVSRLAGILLVNFPSLYLSVKRKLYLDQSNVMMMENFFAYMVFPLMRFLNNSVEDETSHRWIRRCIDCLYFFMIPVGVYLPDIDKKNSFIEAVINFLNKEKHRLSFNFLGDDFIYFPLILKLIAYVVRVSTNVAAYAENKSDFQNNTEGSFTKALDVFDHYSDEAHDIFSIAIHSQNALKLFFQQDDQVRFAAFFASVYAGLLYANNKHSRNFFFGLSILCIMLPSFVGIAKSFLHLPREAKVGGALAALSLVGAYAIHQVFNEEDEHNSSMSRFR